MLKPGIYKVKDNATNSQLQSAIESVIPIAAKQMQGKASAYKSKNKIDTCKNIFNYLKGLNYRADGDEQQVRLPSALMRTRTGDCKSYSVFTSAILTNLKIPHYLTYASYNPNDKTPTHVYVTTKDGCIIDAVYGTFNKEKKPSYKFNKSMNISYIAGIQSNNMKLESKKSNSGACGIMATEGAFEWASRNGIALTNAQKIAISAQKVLAPAIIGRAVIRNIIQKNAGGIATSLQAARVAAGSQKPGQPDWDRVRKIELNWLFKGGNPNELYESISEGATKTPTGLKFYNVLQKLSSGSSVSAADAISAAVSALFGKKYDPATGKITGSGIMGEPATDTAALVAAAPWWQAAIKEIAIALGTAFINKAGSSVKPAAGETPTTPSASSSDSSSPASSLTPVLLIAGAGAALYFLTKNK